MSNQHKPIIGLVGGIGSGKSAAGKCLADLGCLVVDSDAIGREALKQDHIKDALREQWGDGIFDGAGEIDRSAVARIVFADIEERKFLEALTHPWIEAERKRQFADAGSDVPALVIDAPLLMEAGLESECDAVIFIDAPRRVRLSRVEQNRGWTSEQLDARQAAQIPLDVKKKMADYVVDNSGDRSELCDRIRRILDQIVNDR